MVTSTEILSNMQSSTLTMLSNVGGTYFQYFTTIFLFLFVFGLILPPMVRLIKKVFR